MRHTPENPYHHLIKPNEYFSNLARRLDPFIQALQSEHVLTADKQEELQQLIAQIRRLNDLDFSRLKRQPLGAARSRANSASVQFLLQQCHRYNALLNRYITKTSVHEHAARHTLPPIHLSQLAPQASQLKVSSHITAPIFFTEPTLHAGRFFYQASDYRGFIPHYHRCNMRIGRLTQISNLKNASHTAAAYLSCQQFQLPFAAHSFHYPPSEAHHRQAMQHYQQQIARQELGQTPAYNPANPYYQRPRFSENPQRRTITHTGHASTLLQLGAFNLVTDPVHYQTGTAPAGSTLCNSTSAWMSAGAAMLYPRKTAAAFAPTRYPGVHIVWISHNHHDHLCPKTLQEAFPAHTLLIVPQGDGDTLRHWGFHNVIEIGSWNQVVTVAAPRLQQTLNIHAIPAKHASNRMLNDYMRSLYMGCIVEHTEHTGKELESKDDSSITSIDSSRHLVTGDTAVWSDDHYAQLDQWVKQHGIIHSASIAAGPDRPRSLLECTHQSSADALVFHARLNIANYLAQYPKAVVTRTQLQHLTVQANFYHQGCFRLGLHSYHDTRSSITRILACLLEFSTHSVRDLHQAAAFEHSIYYHLMDRFEQQALKALIFQYTRIQLKDASGRIRALTAREVQQLINHSVTVPKVGQTQNLTSTHWQSKLNFSLNDLLVNPEGSHRFGDTVKTTHHSLFDKLQTCGRLYAAHPDSKQKSRRFSAWLAQRRLAARCQHASLETTGLMRLLIQLHQHVQGDERYDERLRDEGRFQMLIILLANHYLQAHMPHTALAPNEPAHRHKPHEYKMH